MAKPRFIYQTIYNKLDKLLPNLSNLPDYQKLQSSQFMDLNVDVLDRSNDYSIIALSHYYKHPSGDMIPDPDMEVRLSLEYRMAEAMSYQDIFGYRQVYHDYNVETGKYEKIDLRAKKELNSFLNMWLRNLLMQGHRIVEDNKNKH